MVWCVTAAVQTIPMTTSTSTQQEGGDQHYMDIGGVGGPEVQYQRLPRVYQTLDTAQQPPADIYTGLGTIPITTSTSRTPQQQGNSYYAEIGGVDRQRSPNELYDKLDTTRRSPPDIYTGIVPQRIDHGEYMDPVPYYNH